MSARQRGRRFAQIACVLGLALASFGAATQPVPHGWVVLENRSSASVTVDVDNGFGCRAQAMDSCSVHVTAGPHVLAAHREDGPGASLAAVVPTNGVYRYVFHGD